ncbi:MAG: DUF3073 domain-containing protein [Aeriscardovia aeriphila]|nr:DUF3073 domain-containing protein [Aeriscardovia aeriphila]
MGRGRQKAKQRRNARKLKYLTTDTDYDQLQRELANREEQEEETPQADPFGQIDKKFQEDREMSEYAKWAEEAALKAKAEPDEAKPQAPKHMSLPSGLVASLAKKSEKSDGAESSSDSEE